MYTAMGSATNTLEAAERARLDVLISNTGMPEGDGYESLRRTRAMGMARGRGVPAIALTALAHSEDRTRARRAGFLVHVSNPADPSELAATIPSVIGRTGQPLA